MYLHLVSNEKNPPKIDSFDAFARNISKDVPQISLLTSFPFSMDLISFTFKN